MPPTSWPATNRRFARWVGQVGAITADGVQIRVLRLHDVVPAAGQGSGLHAHAWLELSVVQHGAITYLHDGVERRVAAGGTFIMPAGRRHGWRVAAGPAVITGYQLLVTAAEAAGRARLERWCARLAAGGWTLPRHALPVALVADLHRAEHTDLGCQLMRTHLLWSFERLGAWAEADSGSTAADADDAMVRLRDHLLDHLAEDLRLAALAVRFGGGPRNLNRRFAQLTGMPVHRFIVTQRLDRAAHSLRWQEVPVAEIARSVGYADAGYFGRLFRTRFGTSPERWRNAERRRRSR